MATRTEMTNDKFKCMVWDDKSILDTLQHEAIELKDKIENARNKGDYGTYKNLILAFKEIINLIHEEKEKTEWKDMFSHYKMKIDDEFQDVVSTWRQRGEDIEDHKVYKIEKEICNLPISRITLDKIEKVIGYTIFAESNKDSLGYILNDIFGAWNHIKYARSMWIFRRPRYRR